MILRSKNLSRLKRKALQFMGLGLVVLGTAFVFSLSGAPHVDTSYAWCETDNGDRTELADKGNAASCLLNLEDEATKIQGTDINGNPRKITSAKDFESNVNNCVTNGNAAGWDWKTGGQRRQECANALLTCQREALSTTDCTANNLAEIGDSCNSGMRTSGGNDNCRRLQTMNGEQINTVFNDACAGKDDTADGTRSQEACKAETRKQCTDKDMLQDNGSIRGGPDRFGSFRDCVAGVERSQAKNKTECEGRTSGKYVWVEDTIPDPNGNPGNSVTKGCKLYTDLVNPDACKRSGSDGRSTGAWAKKKGSDSWGCYDPNDVCKNPDYQINDREVPCSEENLQKNQTEGDKPGKSGFANSREDFKSCGEAQTVLLSCDQQKDCPGSTGVFSGLPVLGCVIRIGIQVLTTLIGIGAVGGIAFEAFRYASASDSESQVSQAKTRIRDIIIGVLLWVFLIVVANWLIPGLGIQ